MKKRQLYRAESFDTMQYLYGAAHDPLIHCVIRLSDRIDAAALKRAVSLSLSAIPIIRCCFEAKPGPRWADHGFTGADIVREAEAEEDEERQVWGLLAATIDIFHEPQLKIIILRGRSADTLCVIINHMVCDGAGFKEYLYLLANLYTQCESGAVDIPAPKAYSRGTGQLFRGFTLTQKVHILFLKYDISVQREQTPYRLAGNMSRPFFSTLRIGEDLLSLLKAEAKWRGVTLNDMVLCAYIRALHRRIGGERVVMPCPVDLRKYLPPGQPHGICNLTSNYICDVPIRDGDPAERTLSQVAAQMDAQKKSLACLKSMISMELAFRTIPFGLMKAAFLKVFVLPLVSFTNLGVIDRDLLAFGGAGVADAYMTGAVKRVPYFQVSISTFDGCCTLGCNLFGTPEDEAEVARFLAEVRDELLSFTASR